MKFKIAPLLTFYRLQKDVEKNYGEFGLICFWKTASAWSCTHSHCTFSLTFINVWNGICMAFVCSHCLYMWPLESFLSFSTPQLQRFLIENLQRAGKYGKQIIISNSLICKSMENHITSCSKCSIHGSLIVESQFQHFRNNSKSQISIPQWLHA